MPGKCLLFFKRSCPNYFDDIHDIRGAEVADLARGFHEAGYYSISFSPENLSSGTYLYVLDSGSFREVKRMVYLK